MITIRDARLEDASLFERASAACAVIFDGVPSIDVAAGLAGGSMAGVVLERNGQTCGCVAWRDEAWGVHLGLFMWDGPVASFLRDMGALSRELRRRFGGRLVTATIGLADVRQARRLLRLYGRYGLRPAAATVASRLE